MAVTGTDGAATVTGINKGCIRKLKRLFRGHCSGWFSSYIQMSFLGVMFLLNWIEVRKIWSFCWTNRQNNWAPMSRNG